MPSAAKSIPGYDGFDFDAFSRGAKTIVASDWNAQAARYETIARNTSDPADRRMNELLAQDLRDSAAKLLETIQ